MSNQEQNIPAGDGLTDRQQRTVDCVNAWLKDAGLPAYSVPSDGAQTDYVLVPRAMTDAMEGAFADAETEHGTAQAMWQAAILAAPRQPGEMGAGVQTQADREMIMRDVQSDVDHLGIGFYRTNNDGSIEYLMAHQVTIVRKAAASAEITDAQFNAATDAWSRVTDEPWSHLGLEAAIRAILPAASAQQNDGGDETKWNCHCGNANCAGLHPNDASAQQDEREAFEAWHLATFKEKAPEYPLDPEFAKRFQDPVWMAWQARAAQQVQADAGAVAWIAEHENDELDFVNFHEEVARQQAEESGALRVRPLVYGDAYTRPAAESDKP